MRIRLQKIIAQAGLTSRREAEQWIADGRVSVNGHVISEMGTLADPQSDVIKIGNRRLPRSEAKQYILLNKPPGCVTTENDERGRPTVMDYIKKVETRVFPVGRLDFNTQGLLLFTNDGELAQKLLDPKYKIPRIYQVKVRGTPEEKVLKRLRNGVPLNNHPTEPLSVRIHRQSGKNCFLAMKLHEGKNRHVKRVCEKVGHPVIRLKRTHFAFLGLQGIALGHYRYLTTKETASLKQLVKKYTNRSKRSLKEVS